MKQFKEPLKNIILTAEVISIVVLLYTSYQYILSGHLGFAGSRLESGYVGSTALLASQELDLSEYVYPLSAAICTDGEVYGAKNNISAVNEIYGNVSTVLAEAVGSCGDAYEITEEEFYRIISGKIVFLGFGGDIPLYTMCYRQNAVSDIEVLTDTSRFIVMFAGNDDIELIYRSGSSGKLMKAGTAARSKTLDPIWDAFMPNGAEFAVCSGEAFKMLLPETLLLNRSVLLPVIEKRIPLFKAGSEKTASVFSAFDYDPYTVRSYEEKDGTQVYVDNLSTIRISQNGILWFNAPEKDGIKIDAYQPDTQTDREHEIYLIKAAADIISGVSDGFTTQSSFFLAGINKDSDGTYTIHFGKQIGGIPILPESSSVSYVTVTNDVIVSAYIDITCYDISQQNSAVLPELQVVPVIDTAIEGRFLLRVCYYVNEQNKKTQAEWYYESLKGGSSL